MNIVILNGNPRNETNGLDEYVETLKVELNNKNHAARDICVDDLNMKACIGCFGCWTEHPGKCKFDDDGAYLFTQVINADLVLLVSPLKMGFTSPSLKKVLDRFIVLLHPYMELVDNECHHQKRYAKYPRLSLLVHPDDDTDSLDLEIIGDIYQRFALNFHSSIELFETTQKSSKEIANAFDHI